MEQENHTKMWMELINSECMNMICAGEGGNWEAEKTHKEHTGGLDDVSAMCCFF